MTLRGGRCDETDAKHDAKATVAASLCGGRRELDLLASDVVIQHAHAAEADVHAGCASSTRRRCGRQAGTHRTETEVPTLAEMATTPFGPPPE